MRLSCTRAQSILEFSMLAVIIIVALIAMQAYMKRGLQGKWRDSVDQLGDQYDPSMSGTTTLSQTSQSSTELTVSTTTSTRKDTDNSQETKKVDMKGSL